MTESPRPHPRERGQAAVEFVALVLVACLVLGALVAFAPAADGRAVGGFLVHRLSCAVSGRCDSAERELVRAYGQRDAALVRALAPNLVFEGGERQLPVDWRHCRRAHCASAPDHGGLDAHLTDRGHRATAFTRVIRRNGRLYVAYWLYYPDSNSAVAGSDRVWERSWLLPRLRRLVDGSPDYPGYHRDDWEGAFVRVDPDGTTWLRASAHGRYRGCKWRSCAGAWTRGAGWVRVSRGSHSGHVPFRTDRLPPEARDPRRPRYLPRPGWETGRVRRVPAIPGRDLHERSATGEGLRLIPLETHDHDRYRPLDPGIAPPWRKPAYRDPESDES
jgi:hypothetical protein